MNLFNLMATMGIDTTDFERGLTEAEAKTKTMVNNLKEIATSNENVNNTLGKVGTACKVMGGAMGVALGVGVKGAIDLETSMAKVQAQTGKTDEEMKAIEKSIRSLYKEGIGGSVDEVAESFAYAQQLMGDTNVSIEDVTRNASQIAVLFGGDVNGAIETVNMMMQQMGVSSDEAFNLLAQGAQSGANAQGNLLETVREFGPAFTEAGFSSEQMMTVLAEGAKNGAFDISRLADAMNEYAIRAIDGSKTSQEAFASLGISVEQVNEAYNKGGDAMNQLTMEALQNLTTMGDKVEQERIGVALFGSMWEDNGAKVMSALGKANSGILEHAKGMEAVKQQQETTAIQIARIKRTYEDWAITIADKLIPYLQNMVTWIKENKETCTTLAIAIGGVIGAIMMFKSLAFVVEMVTLAKTVYGAVKGIQLMTMAQSALNIVMNMNPIGLIITGITTLIGVLVLLYNKTEWFRNLWDNAWASIKTFFMNAWNAIQSGWNSMISWLQNLGNKIREFAINWFTYWNNMRIKVMEAIQGMIEWFKKLPQRLGEALRNCITKLVQWVIDMKNKGLEAGRGLVNSLIDTIKSLPQRAMEIAKQIPTAIWNGIQSMTGWLYDKVSGFFSNIFNWFGSDGINATANIQSALNLGGVTSFGAMQGISTRGLGSTSFHGAFRPQTTNVSLSIGGREFDKLVIKTVADNYGKIESRIQSKERGKR